MTAHSGRVWGKTPVQSVLKLFCQSTTMGGASVHVTSHRQTARFEKGVKILVDKKKIPLVYLYHYSVVVYTHCQHTFKFKQLEKVHVVHMTPLNKNPDLVCWSPTVYTTATWDTIGAAIHSDSLRKSTQVHHFEKSRSIKIWYGIQCLEIPKSICVLSSLCRLHLNDNQNDSNSCERSNFILQQTQPQRSAWIVFFALY